MDITQEIGIPIDLTAGTFVDTEVRDGLLQLQQVNVDDAGNDVFKKYGHWVSDVIEIKDKVSSFKQLTKNVSVKENGTFRVFTSSSSNMRDWTEWVEVDYVDNSIKSPVDDYARVKIEITASESSAIFTVDEFVTTGKYDNTFINSSNGVLELKRNYLYPMNNTLTDVNGILFVRRIKKTKFKKINRIRVT